MNTLAHTSIVIPFAPDDMSWQNLLLDLQHLPKSTEIILVTASEHPSQRLVNLQLPVKAIITSAHMGRGSQMNAGARIARNPCLWFLHADSRIDTACLKALDQFEFKKPRLAYFGLRFLNDGPNTMGINRFGVWFRSRFLFLPFGDQGFAISKANFEKLGGYREDLSAGEDHAFVWRARKNGVALKALNASIQTSARKYAKYGWGKTTRTHLRETWRQALAFSKQATRQ